MDNELFEKAPIPEAYFSLAMPVVLSMLVTLVYNMVDTYFIVDEAQNLTPHEIKTIITRAGENTKMIFTGDIFQIDHPYLDIYSNGLSYLIDKMQGQKLYTHIFLEKGERSVLAGLARDLL